MATPKRKHDGNETLGEKGSLSADAAAFTIRDMDIRFQSSSETKQERRWAKKVRVEQLKDPRANLRFGSPLRNAEDSVRGEQSPSIRSYAPRGLNVIEYAEARALEIRNLHDALLTAKDLECQLAFQKLPRHMRRRAASHDVKRVPRRLRDKVAKQISATLEKKSKKPAKKLCRKRRRSGKMLLDEHARRARKHCWLETHLWHAKRFRMVKKWGYTLAEEPFEKSFRSTYRASAKSCLLQDKSFMETIEIVSSDEDVIQKLRLLCDEKSGRALSEPDFTSGKTACDVFLYHKGTYPNGAIGPVRLLCKSFCSADDRVLWIECHPTISNELLEELARLFGEEGNADVTSDEPLARRDNDSRCGGDDSRCGKDDSRCGGDDSLCGGDDSLCGKDDSLCRDDDSRSPECSDAPVTWLEDRSGSRLDDATVHDTEKISSHATDFTPRPGTRVKLYKLQLVRFSLTGPLSNSIVANALRVCSKEFQKATVFSEKSACAKAGVEWARIFRERETQIDLACSFWTAMATTPVEALPGNSIIGLIVKDPRLDIPHKKRNPHEVRQKTEKSNGASLDISSVNLAYSPIWDSELRRLVNDCKVSDADINKRRSELLVPGQSLNSDGGDCCLIPLLLIKRRGCPIRHEQGRSESPGYGQGWDVILPTTWGMPFWMALVYQGVRVGGLREEANVSLEALRIVSPVSFPDCEAGRVHEDKLRSGLEAKHQRYPPQVRRNYDVLGVRSPFHSPWLDMVKQWNFAAPKLLISETRLPVPSGVEGFHVLRDDDVLSKLSALLFPRRGDLSDSECQSLASIIASHANSLVRVSVLSTCRGCMEDLAILSGPTDADLELLDSKGDQCDLREPPHKGLLGAFPFVCLDHAIHRHNVLEIGCNTRWTVGRVQRGRFLLSKGRGAGIGLMPLLALVCVLLRQLERERKICLFRNTDTLQYRFCVVEIM